MPRSSENTGVAVRASRPPGRIVSVTNSMREASRRRRARNTGMSAKDPITSAKQSKQKSLSKSKAQPRTLPTLAVPPAPKYEEMTFDWTKAGPSKEAAPPITIGLPTKLRRPEMCEIKREVLLAADPSLEDTPVQYIRDKLVQTGAGSRMLNVVSATTPTAAVGESLPSELSVLVSDVNEAPPTHMLAVYAAKPTTPRQRVTLYPVHQIILAAHCAHLPALSPSGIENDVYVSPDELSVTTVLPVVPLRLPHPESFPQLTSYLYTKRVDPLLAVLLPPAPTPTLDDTEAGAGPRERLAHALARTYTPRSLLQRAMGVNGLWRNVCALGISDARLWNAMDVAWEVLLSALSIATGAIMAETETPSASPRT